jgi:hypothetical protein
MRSKQQLLVHPTPGLRILQGTQKFPAKITVGGIDLRKFWKQTLTPNGSHVTGEHEHQNCGRKALCKGYVTSFGRVQQEATAFNTCPEGSLQVRQDPEEEIFINHRSTWTHQRPTPVVCLPMECSRRQLTIMQYPNNPRPTTATAIGWMLQVFMEIISALHTVYEYQEQKNSTTNILPWN